MFRNVSSKMKSLGIIAPCIVLLAATAFAQGPNGMRLGNLELRPEAGVLAAYDDRVFDGPAADGDLYAEAAAGVRLNNLPAWIDFTAAAYYGYRFYNEYTGLNDDFYTVMAALESREDPIKWGLLADWRKSLNYNTTYDPGSGRPPDSILNNEPNRRLNVEGDVAYDWLISDNSSLRPGYRVNHYNQEFQSGETAEWQIHRVGIQYRRGLGETHIVYVGAAYSLQANDDEDGFVGSAVVGAEGEITEKTSWNVEIGYAHADYELSGKDDGVVSVLRGLWQATDKISVYAFGGNDFQPGYQGGAARWVARVGYGLNWRILEKLELRGSVLHDYQEAIGGNPVYDQVLGELRTFMAVSAEYRFTDRFSSELGYRHNRDEKNPDQNIIFLSATYAY